MVAAIVINYFPDMLTWRFAIQLQAVCEVPVAIIFFFQDNKKIDVLADMKHPSQSVPLIFFKSNLSHSIQIQLILDLLRRKKFEWTQLAIIITKILLAKLRWYLAIKLWCSQVYLCVHCSTL